MPTPMIVYAQVAHYFGKIDISQKDAVQTFFTGRENVSRGERDRDRLKQWLRRSNMRGCRIERA
jgi:hypothetical protein